MKKTFKKSIAVLLVTLIIALCMPLQSFAIFDSFKVPIIETIEFNENAQPISLKEVDNYFNNVLDSLEEEGVDIEYIKENYPEFFDIIFNFSLYASSFDYSVDVTLASGETYTVSDEEYRIEFNKYYDIEIECFISYDQYLQAKENGADEIEVEVNGNTFSYITSEYCDSSEYSETTTLPLVDMAVKSITPLSGIPDVICGDADYVDIDEAEFLIEYADGTKVTDKAVRNDEMELNMFGYGENYTVDGNTIFVGWDYDEDSDGTKGRYYIYYLDAEYVSAPVQIKESLISDIKITDCVFDADNAILSLISYDITYTDGQTYSFTKVFSQYETGALDMGLIINIIDGYAVYAYVTLGDYDIFNDSMNADEYHIEISAGSKSDVYKVDNPNKDIINGTWSVIDFFVNIISKIQSFFDFLFGLLFFGFNA